jgi:ferrous iron transport protein B
MPSAPARPAPSSAPVVRAAAPRAVLIGNPNTGKTSLFNRLCGVRAKTANFPGTTTSVRVGRSSLETGQPLEVLDLPGVYELQLDTPEARIVRDVLAGRSTPAPDILLVIVDAANLARNLVLVGELLATGLPTVVCLNMTDIAERRGWRVDARVLSAELGAPVLPMVASRGQGIADLRATLAAYLMTGAGAAADPPARPRAGATLEELAAWARSVAEAAGGHHSHIDEITERVDAILTHPVSGLLVFTAIMGGLFWTLFALAAVPMDLIEGVFAELGALASAYLPAGPIRDLVTDGIIGGIAGAVVFLPQICFLFFLISLLEDTGYLARAAFVMDRFLHRFGLPGHAFVPLLTSHACALPGIISTRLIPDPKDRLRTILVAPFMSCSARLPVFVLLTTLLFADSPALAAAAFAGCFVLGAAAAFLSALLFSRTVVRGRARPMILELPKYQLPSLRNALLTARDQGVSFLQTAGTVIMAICIVMWWLSAYPKADPSVEADALRARAATSSGAAADALLSEADALDARAQQQSSFAGRMGRAIQPVFAPLGYDWQLTAGLLTSFVAREVFVSTMSVLAGGGEAEGVRTHIQSMRRDDGTPVFTRATSASALVFFVLAMQCLPTLAVTRRETGRLRYAGLQLGYMSTVAYVSAFATYQILRVVGVE